MLGTYPGVTQATRSLSVPLVFGYLLETNHSMLWTEHVVHLEMTSLQVPPPIRYAVKADSVTRTKM